MSTNPSIQKRHVDPYMLCPFLDRVGELEKFSTLTDFTISCGDRDWRVHRAVLIVHSSVLAKACTSDFQEAKQSRIDLSDHSLEAVSALVQFLYHFSYAADVIAYLEMPPKVHVEIAILADKYDIPALKRFATTRCRIAISKKPNMAQAWDDLSEAIELAYDTRSAVKDICIEIITVLADWKPFLPGAVTCTAMQTTLRENSALLLDMVRASNATVEKQHRRVVLRCPTCKWTFWVAKPPNDSETIWCEGYKNRSQDQPEEDDDRDCNYEATSKFWIEHYEVEDDSPRKIADSQEWWQN